MRICSACKKTEPEARFGKGRKGVCNSCSKARWEKENQLKVRVQRLWGNAYKRCIVKGWPLPDFDCKFIEDKIKAGVCEVTGIPFDLFTRNDSVHAQNPWVPSIDRIDSNKPYQKDNIQIVVYMYNVCKGEFTHDDVVTFSRSVVRKEHEIGL